MERWIKLSDLRRHLHWLLKDSRSTLEEAKAYAINDAEGAQALADAYLWNEAEEQIIADVGQWAMCNAVQGIALPTGSEDIF